MTPELLKYKRKEILKIEQAQLALLLDVSVRTVIRFESGEKTEKWYNLALDGLIAQNGSPQMPARAIGEVPAYQPMQENAAPEIPSFLKRDASVTGFNFGKPPEDLE